MRPTENDKDKDILILPHIMFILIRIYNDRE